MSKNLSEKELNHTGAENKLTYDEVKKYADFILNAHQENDITKDEVYRQFGKTPYPTHCILAAHLFLSDQRIPWEERKSGYLALLLHDIKENTDKEIPNWVEAKVKVLVEELTIDRSNNDATTEQQVFGKSDQVKLLIFVDMLSNLYEEHVKPENRERWLKAMKMLIEVLYPEYGDLRVFVIGKALISDTDWSGYKL